MIESKRTVRIGLTGPIGCGKSTVAGWLRDLGAVVIDADVLAREVTERGEPTLAAVERRFGPAVIRPDGALDRGALGRIVFANPAALRDLESIVHPAVRPRIESAVAAAEQAGAPAVVIEAIKLVEGGYAAACDEVWLVVCAAGEQRRRLLARGLAEADVEQRIAAQGNMAERLAGAVTRRVDTSGGIADARDRVVAAYREALSGPDAAARG